jgi:LacI family transcriptional regulator
LGRKTTARDVAAAAGVSASTVDRVLNGRGGVHPDKERRVVEWARKLKLDRAMRHRSARTLRVAVLIQPPDNPFFAEVQNAFSAANRAYGDFNIQFLAYHYDPGRLSSLPHAIRDLGARHDGLIVSVPHGDAVAEAIRTVSAKIPVVTLASDVRECGRHAYVGPDDRRAGRVAGDLMGRFLAPAGGDIVMIAGLLSLIGNEEREMGFRSVLRERYPECRVAVVLESQERAERAGELVRDALTANPNIRGVYNVSAGAPVVVAALRALKREDVVFITHELTPDRRALLRQGLIDAIIDQNTEFEVRTAVETMARLTGRLEGASDNTITPVHIHTIENA